MKSFLYYCTLSIVYSSIAFADERPALDVDTKSHINGYVNSYGLYLLLQTDKGLSLANKKYVKTQLQHTYQNWLPIFQDLLVNATLQPDRVRYYHETLLGHFQFAAATGDLDLRIQVTFIYTCILNANVVSTVTACSCKMI